MAFQNTVEIVGDAALTDSLINRTITELNDNIVEIVERSALKGCTALTKVNLPNVTEIKYESLQDCSNLKVADFSKLTTIGQTSFSGCNALEALIIRNTDVVPTIEYSLGSCGIGNGGYIYVPSALVDSYKATQYWSNHADYIRAIEDYPEVCDTYSWVAVFKCIDNGTYKNVYKIGDLIPIDLGAAGLTNMEIVALDADELADGSGNAHITFISKELVNWYSPYNPVLVTNEDGTYQEGTGTIGGWEKSACRAKLKEIKPLIPENVRNRIREVNKYSNIYNTSGVRENNVLTIDDVWIPSAREMKPSYGISETIGVIYSEAFSSDNKKKKCHIGSSSSVTWKLRSSYGTNFACAVDSFGNSNVNSQVSTYSAPLPLGFCV